MTPSRDPDLRHDLILAALLVAICVIARATPHAWNFLPIAGAALFAGTVMHTRWLAVAVSFLGMLGSDLIIGFDEWRMVPVLYVAVALPALVAYLPPVFRAPGIYIPLAIASSLAFFAVTNFAVWAFSGMYTHDWAGLVRCYTLALPFLKSTIAGDLFWSTVLFAGYWLVGRFAPARRTA